MSKLRAEVPLRHRRAFDVPARSAVSPRTRPRCRFRLVVFAALPQREIAGVTLGARVGVGGGLHVVDALTCELAVGRPALHVEVDVAGLVAGDVGVPGVDESADEVLHLRDARRRTRLVGGRPHAQRRVARGELELEPVGQCPPLLRTAFGLRGRRIDEDLVVDVGHVAHEGHVVATMREPAAKDVVDERRPQVPDVRRRLHRGSADVHADRAIGDGAEVTERLGPGVVESHSHASSLRAGLDGRRAASLMCRNRIAGHTLWRRSAVAITATPSPRPVNPRPSVVVALMDTGAPTNSLSNASAS